MTESSQKSGEVCPSVLDRAAEQAARRGQSVPEYLNTVLAAALARTAPAEIAQASKTSADPAVQRRVEAIKRRLDTASDSFEGAIEALDAALADMTSRIGAVEALSGDAAGAAAELAADVRSFRSRLESAVRTAAQSAEENQNEHAELAAAFATLCRRLEAVDARAEASIQAQEDLKRAVAEDFCTFAQETGARLNAGLDDVRAAADVAAEQAEAAAAHVVSELRSVREALEARLSQSAAETRAKVQAAFADTSERLAALSARVDAGERAQSRLAEDVRARLAGVEDGMQAALEQTADALRCADAELMNTMARAQEDTREAIAKIRSELNELRQSPPDAAGAAASEAEVAALKRELALAIVEARGRAARHEDEWETRLEELALRFQRDLERAAEERQLLRADTERVEACTLAALEKLSGDIAAGDIALEARLQRAVRLSEETMAQLRANLDDRSKELQRQHESVAERIERLSGAVSVLQADAAPLHARVTRIERVEARAEAEQAAIIALAQRVGDLEQRNSAGLEDLRAQIAGFIASNDERLAALEAGDSFDAETVIAQFSDLRIRVEERIAEVEQRSVRMLEQVAETVLLLDKRLSGAPAAAPAKIA